MGSYYQPANYLKGGKRRCMTRKNNNTRKSRKQNGGFYPSIMGGVMSAGKLLMAASLRQGYKMLTSSSNRGKKTRKSRHLRKN